MEPAISSVEVHATQPSDEADNGADQWLAGNAKALLHGSDVDVDVTERQGSCRS